MTDVHDPGSQAPGSEDAKRAEPDRDMAQARGRAIASPLRMRILRLCLHDAYTNKEIAERMGLNPATALHHVRTLVNTGFLEPEAERTGRHGAKEIPYRATGLSWGVSMPNAAPVLVETFLQDIDGLMPDEIDVWRLGVKLNEAHRQEMMGRIREVFNHYAHLPADDDGVPTSLFLAHHIDKTAEPRTGQDAADTVPKD